MKNFFIKYYAIIMVGIFILNNLILVNLYAGGILYNIVMIILIFLNAFILNKFKGKIKGKNLVIILYFIFGIFSKNIFHVIFAFSSFIILIVTNFLESKITKIFACLVSLLFIIAIIICFPVIIWILVFGILKLDVNYGIYEDTHYICENHSEIYFYSAGAMDSYHFNVGKYYEFLNIDDIIYVAYRKSHETSYAVYERTLKNNKCKLVGAQNEFK